ncbi:von Willebrand factor type A domain-containing protein [Herbihabitans rhizosphaerae]|uniref:von Willebrand factor type A domain-containing protein n=1 Tax=Herbihabitans rhizosphaerae TaxID=1872711 RepID=A0A4Q7L4F2_9PSEU|nr:vWA domain-containing protein [Herbihabitans rhizosphaerae]RZS43660.1 von Willebrand factor type A domain-containing protein [Herbihabitans rhizosphaerae]
MSRRISRTTAAVIIGIATAIVAPATALADEDLTLEPGQSATVSTSVPTPLVGPRPDIVFLADTTGGMDPVLANVRNNIGTITDRVLADQPDARFGIAEYKEQVNGPQVFQVRTPLTDDMNAVRAGAQNWLDSAGGGGTPETDFINAHFRLATDAIAWRPNSTRIIAWFGDARSNDPSLGHTLADAGNALRAANIRVVAVPVSGGTGGGLDAFGQATAIVDATGGALMPPAPADQVATALSDGMRRLEMVVTHRLGTCDSAVTMAVGPAGVTVRAGTPAPFTKTVGVLAGTPPGVYRCTVQYLINGSPGTTETTTVTVGDAVAPTITVSVSPAAPNGQNGWYTTAPAVTFTCSDASGIASCTPPVTLTSAATPQSVTGTATDTKGNSAQATVNGLKVDLVDPAVSCGQAPTFTVGSPAMVGAGVADVHSGPVSPGTAASADTATAGARTVRVTGSDLAGRTGAADCAYTVIRAPTAIAASPAKITSPGLLRYAMTTRAVLTRTDNAVPLAGHQIRFTHAGRQLCVATTDAAGVAGCTGAISLVESLRGGYTATFAGTPAFAPAAAQVGAG